ncbi:MAG: DNA gyrase inhibitor YacG [Glaciimonas sp.]|nr:DNA gyrase inhibitor YacG [Glaciimonas sp.]
MMAIADCPTCGTKVEWIEASRFRPFCSERYKQIDLGAWAEEKYIIPAVNPLE